MKLLKPTVLSSLCLALLFSFSSCEKNAEKKKTTDYQKNAIPITGAQVYPTSASTALGSLDVFYTKETRLLNYTINWSGLAGPVTFIHVHGPTPAGFTSLVAPVQIVIGAGGLATPGSAYGITSKFSGTLLADGVVVKEDDIISGNYYIDIHTAAYPGGEIRAQIKF